MTARLPPTGKDGSAEGPFRLVSSGVSRQPRTMSLPKTTSGVAPVGLIGLGLVGQAMAGRLVEAGRDVVGYDVRAEARDGLVVRGGLSATTAVAVAESCRIVLLSLPGDREVGLVLDQLRPAWRPGSLLIDTTTGDPAAVPARAAALAALGVGYLDATLSGSSTQIARGEALCMVGGEDADFHLGREILSHLADAVRHVGPPGNGSRMKLVTNLVLGLNRAVLAEGLVLAGALGLDRAAALDVLRSSMAASRVMDTKGDRMVQGRFEPEARLSQHLKDVRLILAGADRAGRRLPLSERHRDLLEAAESLGLGSLDNSAILRVIEVLEGPPAAVNP